MYIPWLPHCCRAATAAEMDTVIELAGGGIDTLDFGTLAATVPVTVDLATAGTVVANHPNRKVGC